MKFPLFFKLPLEKLPLNFNFFLKFIPLILQDKHFILGLHININIIFESMLIHLGQGITLRFPEMRSSLTPIGNNLQLPNTLTPNFTMSSNKGLKLLLKISNILLHLINSQSSIKKKLFFFREFNSLFLQCLVHGQEFCWLGLILEIVREPFC